MDMQVKSLGDHRIGGYGVVFGDADHTDLEGDYFTRSTDFWLDHYQGQPLIYDHAMGDLPGQPDDMPRHFVYGTIKEIRPDEVGLWFEAEVDDRNEWVQYVLDLIDKGMLNWSSGSVPHLVKRAEDGKLLSWPIVEGSTTPTPAEPRRTNVVRLKHYVLQDVQTDSSGAPDEGAQAIPGAPDAIHPTTDEPYAHREVSMSIDLKSMLRPICGATLDDVWTELGAEAKSAVKQGGSAIADMLQPVADQVAETVGVTSEEALAVLVSLALEKTGAAAEPEMGDETMSEDPDPSATLSVDMDALADKVAEKMASHFAPAPRGKFVAKNVNVNLGRNKPDTLGRYIKAVRDRDMVYLNQRHQGIKAQYKALGINPDTAGGYLVAPEQSNEVIELLRAEAAVLPLCRQVPLNRDTLQIPLLSSGATAYWVGENAQITESQQAFGQITLVAKKLGILVKVSNELLEDSDPSVDAIIREDIALTAAEEIDRVILLGSGIGDEPRGLLNIAAVTKTALNAAPTFNNVVDCISRVEQGNVRVNPGWQWVMNPREKATLSKILDTEGQYVWTELGLPGYAMNGGYPTTLRGYGYKTTTKLDIDAAHNDETEVFFGQWNDVVVGMRKSLEIVASNQAGTSFEYDQTWIRALLRMDLNIRHAESIEILTDVRAS